MAYAVFNSPSNLFHKMHKTGPVPGCAGEWTVGLTKDVSHQGMDFLSSLVLVIPCWLVGQGSKGPNGWSPLQYFLQFLLWHSKPIPGWANLKKTTCLPVKELQEWEQVKDRRKTMSLLVILVRCLSFTTEACAQHLLSILRHHAGWKPPLFIV